MAEKRKMKKHEADELPLGSEDAGAGAAGSEETDKEECERLLDLKDDEIKQLQDRVLRLAAEMENTRKRLDRERSDGISFANESLIRDLLPVIDNLERAIKHAENESDTGSLLDGVRMTYKSFLDVLAKFGCVSFESVGKAFDPNFHEAVMQQETTEYPEMTVVQEFQKGFTLRDRLIRAAMVVVSKAAESARPESE
ncbi:MAG: nucleotide exchange factor GrpE [Syntrophobacteraceae bacterium]